MSDLTFSIGYDLSGMKADGHAAALAARQHAAEIAKEHRKAAAEVKKSWQEFARDGLGFVGLGAGVFGVVESVKSIAEQYSQLADFSKRFEASPESMQRLSIAARLGGTNIESLVNSTQKLLRNLDQTDDPKVLQALREMRLEAVDLIGLSPEKVIEKLSAAFNRAQSEGRGFSAVFDLMGKSAGELIPLLRDYIAHAADAAHAKILSDEDVARIKEGTDAFALLIEEGKAAVAQRVLHPDMIFGDLSEWISIRKEMEEFKRGLKTDPLTRSFSGAMEHGADDLRPLMHTADPKQVAEANKTLAEVAAFKERQETASREKTRAALVAASEAEAGLSKQLLEIKREAYLAELGPLEKLAKNKTDLLNLERSINYARENGPRQVGEVLWLEIAREKILKDVNAAERENAALQSARSMSRGDARRDLEILEAKAHHHDRKAGKLERQAAGEKETRRLVALGIGPTEAAAMAARKQDAEDRIAHPERIHGVNYHAPAAHAGLDWLHSHSNTAVQGRMNQEFKFPQLDEVNRKLDRLEGIHEALMEK